MTVAKYCFTKPPAIRVAAWRDVRVYSAGRAAKKKNRNELIWIKILQNYTRWILHVYDNVTGTVKHPNTTESLGPTDFPVIGIVKKKMFLSNSNLNVGCISTSCIMSKPKSLLGAFTYTKYVYILILICTESVILLHINYYYSHYVL